MKDGATVKFTFLLVLNSVVGPINLYEPVLKYTQIQRHANWFPNNLHQQGGVKVVSTHSQYAPNINIDTNTELAILFSCFFTVLICGNPSSKKKQNERTKPATIVQTSI